MTAHDGRGEFLLPTAEQVEGGPGLEVVLHQEQVRVATERVAVERVRVSKRIVTQTRSIEVPVLVEQLVVHREPLSASESTTLLEGGRSVADADDADRDDLVIVLHEEVPDVTLRVVAVERVVVGRRSVAGEETLSVELAAEVADITAPGTRTDVTTDASSGVDVTT